MTSSQTCFLGNQHCPAFKPFWIYPPTQVRGALTDLCTLSAQACLYFNSWQCAWLDRFFKLLSERECKLSFPWQDLNKRPALWLQVFILVTSFQSFCGPPCNDNALLDFMWLSNRIRRVFPLQYLPLRGLEIHFWEGPLALVKSFFPTTFLWMADPKGVLPAATMCEFLWQHLTTASKLQRNTFVHCFLLDWAGQQEILLVPVHEVATVLWVPTPYSFLLEVGEYLSLSSLLHQPHSLLQWSLLISLFWSFMTFLF